ncbi:hypothetical protein [Streptomyces sp. NBC_01233]|uniref:hypothetical protein n=1 Tax=Streptomyces sp. NBC_01233 TaxID=2903787 RepID=UPI002E0F110C|nr:hypothetical protein OG332_10805 [Streptomyces sp. NBC_01233]
MTCHACGSQMYEDSRTPGRLWCACGTYRDVAETADQVTAREAETARVLALLDMALAGSARHRGAEEQCATDRQTTAEMESTMGQTIQTAGCPKCGGTMYRTVDTDEHGNPIGMGPYVCSNCGNMAG